ncbi:MAG TPA: rhodanese-like domain-containing protein [Candidatus Binataceae bacterium]|nr:rhodanese-like domain-containing protein [Candidatus Binataceae bacterium]
MAELGVITATQLAERMKRADRPVILDVREAFEVACAPFPDAIHVPMDEIPARLAELDKERETVVLCHHGMRSAQVAGYLHQSGFARVLNLAGGIEAWSCEVDPTVPRY